MKNIAFDLKKALSGDYKVVTKSGRPVRILCTDRKESDYPIVALVEDEEGYEIAEGYTLEGRYDIEYGLDMDLCLEVGDDYLTASDLSEFEFALGKKMYGSDVFMTMVERENQEVLSKVVKAASELYDIAETQLINEQEFFKANKDNEKVVLETHVTREGVSDALAKILTDNGIKWYRECDKENDGMYDSDEPTKMFIEEFKDKVETALWGLWQKSDKGSVSNVRYSVQGDVIYDCVGGKEIALNKVIDEVVEALNYERYKDSVEVKGEKIVYPTKPDVDSKGYEQQH